MTVDVSECGCLSLADVEASLIAEGVETPRDFPPRMAIEELQDEGMVQPCVEHPARKRITAKGIEIAIKQKARDEGGYRPPAETPACLCRGNPMAAFFCPAGHLTECHFPLTCSAAQCSHLERYEG